MAPTGLPATAGSGSTESPVLTFQTGPGSITSWHSCKAALTSSCHVGWLQPACQSGRRWSCIWEEMGGAVGSGGTLPKSAVWLVPRGRQPALELHLWPVPMRPWPWPWPSPHRQIRFPEMITISHTTLRAAPGPCQGKKHTVLPFYE